jgi:hypothetical protein
MQCSAALRWRCAHRLFQASLAALRGRTSSGHGVCASAETPSQIIAIIVKAGTPISFIGYPSKR